MDVENWNVQKDSILDRLKNCSLFLGLSAQDINECIKCSQSKVAVYRKQEIIFSQGDLPNKLFILLEGAVVVGDNSGSGKRSIVAVFDKEGDLFGEVFLFLPHSEYEYFAQADALTKVLQMPKDFLYHTCGMNCEYHSKLNFNLLSIFAQKAYFLNQRVRILSCSTLREKIAKVLLLNVQTNGKVDLPMGREELADYLNAARPSVSRELMNMKKDGLIMIDKKAIMIADVRKLQELT